jgi:hypothetical protein
VLQLSRRLHVWLSAALPYQPGCTQLGLATYSQTCAGIGITQILGAHTTPPTVQYMHLMASCPSLG